MPSSIDTILEKIGVYFGVISRHSFTSMLVGTQAEDTQALTTPVITNQQISDKIAAELLNITDGGVPTPELIDEINAALARSSESDKNEMLSAIRICFEKDFSDPANIILRHNKRQGFTMGTSVVPQGTDAEDAYSLRSLCNISSDEVLMNKSRGPGSNTLSVIQVFKNRLSPASRDMGALTFFMRSIPTLEMSRAVPFVDIVLIQQGAHLTGADNRISRLSMGQFLLGNAAVTDTASQQYLSANDSEVLFDNQAIPEFEPSTRNQRGNVQSTPIAISTAGMELFTAPQTLVPANEMYQEGDVINSPDNAGSGRDTTLLRSAPVMDRFRPLMSLKNVSFSVAPSGGMMSYKSGKISLILHDKSRLAEVAAFVRPALYGTSHLQIEYGWAHPASQIHGGSGMTEEENLIGKFIGALRVKEKYQVVNSSFSFDNAGQVQIDMTIAMLSAATSQHVNISLGFETSSEYQNLVELTKIVSEIRERLPENTASAITGEQDVLGALSSPLSAISLSKEVKKALMDLSRSGLLNRSDSSSDLRRLGQAIGDFLGEPRVIPPPAPPTSEEIARIASEASQTAQQESSERRAAMRAEMARLTPPTPPEPPPTPPTTPPRDEGDIARFTRELLESFQETPAQKAAREARERADQRNQDLEEDRAAGQEAALAAKTARIAASAGPARVVRPDGTNGVYGRARRSISNTISSMVLQLKNGDDPFFLPTTASSPSAEIKDPTRYVSLGKIIATFVGSKVAQSGKYRDVQIIFYNFNEKASYMSNRNIASFPVNYDDFEHVLKKALDQLVDMNIAKFMSLMSLYYLHDPGAHAYGFNSLYEDRSEEDVSSRQLRERYNVPGGGAVDLNENSAALLDAEQRILRAAYRSLSPGQTNVAGEVEFKMPTVQALVETIPIRTGVRTSQASAAPTAEAMLRIHIFDSQATSYSTLQSFLDASTDKSVTTLNAAAQAAIAGNHAVSSTAATQASSGASNQTTTQSPAGEFTEQLKAARDAGLIEIWPPQQQGRTPADAIRPEQGQRYRMRGGFSALKQFISRTMPSMRYGEGASGILNASVSTMSDPALTSVNMLRQAKSPDSPTGHRAQGLPLQIAPVECNLETIGCPLWNFGQQVFIDFGTGTTVDAIYGVAGIEHSIAPGEFKTSVKLVGMNSYAKYISMFDQLENALTAIEGITSTGQNNQGE